MNIPEDNLIVDYSSDYKGFKSIKKLRDIDKLDGINDDSILRENASKMMSEITRDIPKKVKRMNNKVKAPILRDRSGKTISKDRLLSSLMRNDGRIIRVMQDLNIKSYGILQKYLSTVAEMKELESFFRRKLINQAEDCLIEVMNGDDDNLKLKASMFVLEHLAGDVYSKNNNQPLINVDLRNNHNELENKIKSIFSIQTVEKPQEITYDENEECIDVNYNRENEEKMDEIEEGLEKEEQFERELEEKQKKVKYSVKQLKGTPVLKNMRVVDDNEDWIEVS